MTEEQRLRKNERIAAAQRRAWANPRLRAQRIAALKRTFADPEKRKARSERKRLEWADPVSRAKHVAAGIAAWKDPVKRLRMYLSSHTPTLERKRLETRFGPDYVPKRPHGKRKPKIDVSALRDPLELALFGR